MERWKGKIALVTGASVGIGAATVSSLLAAGMIVVGVGRRLTKLHELAELLPSDAEFHPLECDVSKEEDIRKVFDYIKNTFGAVHVLINNAGILQLGRLLSPETPTEILKKTMDVNLLGTALCARHAIQLMRETNVDDGHIVNINSIAGHGVPDQVNPQMNIYPASKNAVTALTEILRFELLALKSNIKVSSVSPGFTRTELFGDILQGGEESTWLACRPALTVADIADAIVYVLGTPPSVQITELTIKPVGEPI